MRKRTEKGETNGNPFGTVLIKILLTTMKNHQKNDHPKTWNLMPKGSQNVPEIDANSYQKTMPKRVTNKS